MTFLTALLLTVSIPAAASVYDYIYANSTGTVGSPAATLVSGTAGSSSVSAVAPDAATVTATAGITLYESANAPTSATPVTVDTALSPPGGTGSTVVSRGSTAYLWSPQYTVASTLYAGSWLLDMFALESGKSSGKMTVTISTVDSTGAVVSTVATGSTGSYGTAKTEVTSTLTATTSVSVPVNGYIRVSLLAPTGGANPTSWTVYWGAGQLTNFQSPSTYNYVIAISNSATVTWNVNLATTAAQTSNLGRLTATLSFVSPSSNQIVVTGGALSQSSGAAVSLAASGTIQIQLVAAANALPTSTNTPSTLTFSVQVASTSSTVFAQYTVNLIVN